MEATELWDWIAWAAALAALSYVIWALAAGPLRRLWSSRFQSVRVNGVDYTRSEDTVVFWVVVVALAVTAPVVIAVAVFVVSLAVLAIADIG